MNVRTSPGMAAVQAMTLRGLTRWLALVTTSATLVLALVFAARGLWQFWPQLPQQTAILASAVACISLLLYFRLRVGAGRDLNSRFSRWHVQQLLISGVIFALAVMISPELPGWAVTMVWGVLGVEEFGFWRSVVLGSSPLVKRGHVCICEADRIREGWSSNQLQAAGDRITHVDSTDCEDEACDEAEECRESLLSFSAAHLQQITRYRNELGAEVIQGLLRAELAKNQRTAHIHIAFCPPLTSTPEFTWEQTEGDDATIAIGQLATYGARLDLRLARPAANGDSIVVEFFASCPVVSRCA